MEWKELEVTLGRLGEIASKFPSRSNEAKAIKVASEALFYVHSEEIKDKFVKFMMSKNRVLTPAQITHLRAIGIDPNKTDADVDRKKRKSKPIV